MKEIAKTLNISYNQKHKVAFGVISNYKLFIIRDDFCNRFILSFDIVGRYLSQYKLIALRSAHRSIIDIETFGTHNEIMIAVSANKSEDADNIKSVIRHLVLLLEENYHENCCGACQTTEKKLFPSFSYEKYLYVCYNCRTNTKSKLIVPDGENNLKGFLGAFIISLVVGIFFSFVQVEDTSTASDIAMFSALTGAIIGIISMSFYQRFSRSPKYRKSITYSNFTAQESGVIRMPSTFGIFLSLISALLVSGLTIVSIYLIYLIDNIKLSFIDAVLTLPNILLNPSFNMDIPHLSFPIIFIGSILGVALTLLFVRAIIVIPQKRQI